MHRMRKMKYRFVLPILYLPLLTGCVSDAASFQIDGKELSISLVREQKWIWEPRLDLSVVVTRMPDCQRRHHLKSAPLSAFAVEIFSLDAVTFFLKQGGRTYAVETETCERFRELSETPVGGIGQKYGTFRDVNGDFKFIEEPATVR